MILDTLGAKLGEFGKMIAICRIANTDVNILNLQFIWWCSGGTKAIAEACRRPGKSIEPLDYGETSVYYKKTWSYATKYLHNLLPFEMLPINQLFKSSLNTVFVILFVIYYYN